MQPLRDFRSFLLAVTGTLRRRHKLGRVRMLFSYLGYKLTEIFGGARQSSVGAIRMNTPNYAAFIYLFEEIFINRHYDFTSSNPTPHILDCGGNMGMSVAYFKTLYPQARIEVFEPDPANYQLLESNISLNHWNDCQAHACALAGEEGEMTFHIADRSIGGVLNSLNIDRLGGRQSNEIKVKAVRLSTYINEPIDLLKLDVEGAEMGVLQDLDATGKIRSIETIMIEYHHHASPQVDELGKFLALLEKNKFSYVLTTPLHSSTDPLRFQDIHICARRK